MKSRPCRTFGIHWRLRCRGRKAEISQSPLFYARNAGFNYMKRASQSAFKAADCQLFACDRFNLLSTGSTRAGNPA
jgi:hypothetical protein